MYLTRFRINAARNGARRLLGSPHFMHGAVNMAFPDLPPRGSDAPRVLWRVDHHTSGRADLIMVSPARPDLTHLVEQAGWPTLEEPGWTTFAYGAFLDDLAVGEVWAFRLTANPVHHTRKPGQSRETRTKRTAHLTAPHQVRWLLQRQERAGFEVTRKPADRQPTDSGDEHEVIVHNKAPLQFRRQGDGGPRRDVRLVSVTFDGRLRITDVDAFRHTLTHGLGKAKAYGCGLMTLAPVR
ncbi:type I-E CRISPR-associated protein Cas6/Cse3/CasE [Streptomyces sp. WMMC1477]|uniref:type I-E CRISPR-associated protein Cas6/Cse3/CasE n=1 Tax=Streptomyces sp. WMMC1477 TaxID=3015155 RepID=UPI0022B6B22A|nr:type I-E CRISPR-associated protein Cas6/Cse3/CasE [Streptomyces sp. WMMC1477]MCZ7432313.1 type I-E CRISPR-associated protein Cas6/Cse3/CasE [Streptomyces sp. WMMC1477]